MFCRNCVHLQPGQPFLPLFVDSYFDRTAKWGYIYKFYQSIQYKKIYSICVCQVYAHPYIFDRHSIVCSIFKFELSNSFFLPRLLTKYKNRQFWPHQCDILISVTVREYRAGCKPADINISPDPDAGRRCRTAHAQFEIVADQSAHHTRASRRAVSVYSR